MKLLVIGATKGIGRQTVDVGLARGHSVRAMARSADTLASESAALERFPGDALKAEDVRKALDGVDAVIFSLGIEESISMLWKEVTLFSKATDVLLQEMATAGVSRLIVVTGYGAGESRGSMSRLERAGHGFILGKPYADKDRQEAMLMASETDWTIVRPTILTKGKPRGRYKVLVRPEEWRNGLISRADVAAFLITEAEQANHIRQAVVLTN